MIVGYARVSTIDQNLDRQIEALNKFGVDKIYTDKMSGKNFLRNNYIKMIDDLYKDDCLVIKSIDRLGRNYDMIIDEWRKITKDIGADIVVLDMPLLDTRTTDKNLIGKFISDIVLQILSFVAEQERTNIKERQAEGIRIAKEKGVHMGRPALKIPDNFNELCEKWQKKEIGYREICSLLGMKRTVFYKYAKANGFNIAKQETKKKTKKTQYEIIGKYGSKICQNQKQILDELHITQPTLKKYFNGTKTVIDRLGVQIKKLNKENIHSERV